MPRPHRPDARASGGLTALEELGTDGIQVTDAGLKHLAALPNLRSASFFHIAFPDKGFTGAGFAAFKTLPKLERLTVAGTPFNDKGMAAIAELAQLKEFRTWHTYQTQAGNEHLLKLTACARCTSASACANTAASRTA